MKKNIILIILVVLFIPFIVKAEDDAASFSFEAECTPYPALNKTSKCTLTVKNIKELNITGAKLSITVDNAVLGYLETTDYKVFEYNDTNGIFVLNNIKGNSDKNIKLLVFTLKPTSDEFVLNNDVHIRPMQFSSGSETINFKDTDVTISANSNNDSNNNSSNNNNSNNTVKDSDASLKDLKVNGVSFSSSFSSGKYEYSAETNASEVTIEAAANSSKATVSGTGKKTLKDGDNQFEITVTAENGNRSKYTIIVTKTDKVTDTSVTTTEKSSTKNPKTGVYSITVIGIIVLAISTVIFINRKKLNLFKKI